VDVAALATYVAERSALREPFQSKETRAGIIHRNCAFEESGIAAMVANELAIVDRDFFRRLSHQTLPQRQF
jgi:hypothetical protein